MVTVGVVPDEHWIDTAPPPAATSCVPVWVNRLVVVPKFKVPKFRLVEPAPPLTRQLLVRIRVEAICPVTVVAALALVISVRPSNDKPSRDTSCIMLSSVELPVQRDRQDVAVGTCRKCVGIRDHGAIDRNRYLGAVAHREIALLTDAVAVGAAGIDEQSVGNVLPAIAQVTGDTVAVAATINGHGEAGDLGIAGHLEIAAVTLQVGVERTAPGRALAAEVQAGRHARAKGSGAAHLTGGGNHQAGLDLPGDRRVGTVGQKEQGADSNQCVVARLHMPILIPSGLNLLATHPGRHSLSCRIHRQVLHERCYQVTVTFTTSV